MGTSLMQEGLGAHAMWGLNPSMDLLSHLPSHNKDSIGIGTQVETSVRTEMSVLLLAPGDIGHILRTISCRRRRHRHVERLEIYLWDTPMEVLARHLLLLAVAHDYEVPLRRRASLLLEIYGNALVQERTSKYIARIGKELIELLRAGTGPMSDFVDFSLLKYKERDALDAVFRSWAVESPCDIRTLRDQRLRHFFGLQYDARKTVVDWDYTTRIKEVASIIHFKQYRGWRVEGIAFEFGDQVYAAPNRSLASFAEGMVKGGQHGGRVKEVKGFWIDIRCGPFFTFGISCERSNKAAEDLFLIHNKGTGSEQHRHNFGEVAVYNVLSYLWEIEMGTQYRMTKAHDIYSGLGEEDLLGESKLTTVEELLETLDENEQSTPHNEEVDDGGVQESKSDTKEDFESLPPLPELDLGVQNANIVPPRAPAPPPSATSMRGVEDPLEMKRQRQALARARCIIEAFDGVTLHLMTGDLSTHLNRSKHHRTIDRLHISTAAMQHAGNPALRQVLTPGAAVSLETAKYVVPLKAEQQEAWVTKICEMAGAQGWQASMTPPSPADVSCTSSETTHVTSDTMNPKDLAKQDVLHYWYPGEADV